MISLTQFRLLVAVMMAVAAPFLAGYGCGKSGVPEACNGSASLCSRRYDEVSFPTAHNAMSNADDGWIGPNQEHGIARQLEDGVRAFMLDVYDYRGEPYLCHAHCEFGRRPLVDGLADLRRFMEIHPNEVLSIIFESYVPSAEMEKAFAAGGLDRFVHSQPEDPEWPTLERMIVSGRRLVVFTDFDGGTLPWYHDVWKYAWETHYHFESVEEMSCAINRGKPENSLFILNHFLTSPVAHPSLAAQINVNPYFIDRALRCRRESGRQPNFVTVDFVSIGDLFSVVDELNGLASD